MNNKLIEKLHSLHRRWKDINLTFFDDVVGMAAAANRFACANELEDILNERDTCELCVYNKQSECRYCELSGEPNPSAFSEAELRKGLLKLHLDTDEIMVKELVEYYRMLQNNIKRTMNRLNNKNETVEDYEVEDMVNNQEYAKAMKTVINFFTGPYEKHAKYSDIFNEKGE